MPMAKQLVSYRAASLSLAKRCETSCLAVFAGNRQNMLPLIRHNAARFEQGAFKIFFIIFLQTRNRRQLVLRAHFQLVNNHFVAKIGQRRFGAGFGGDFLQSLRQAQRGFFEPLRFEQLEQFVYAVVVHDFSFTWIIPIQKSKLTRRRACDSTDGTARRDNEVRLFFWIGIIPIRKNNIQTGSL